MNLNNFGFTSLKLTYQIRIKTYHIEHFPRFFLIFTVVNQIPVTLNAIRRLIRAVPIWAFSLVFLVILVNIAFLIGRHRMSLGGGTVRFENGYAIHNFVKPGGPVYKAGIRPGDTIVSINSVPIGEWHYSMEVGDTAIAGILRNNNVVSIPVAVVSLHSFAPCFFWSLFIIAILTSIGSLYLIYKKPHDKSAWLFFIFIQLFMIVINANSNSQKDSITWFALNAIRISSSFLGPVLIHFHFRSMHINFAIQ